LYVCSRISYSIYAVFSARFAVEWSRVCSPEELATTHTATAETVKLRLGDPSEDSCTARILASYFRVYNTLGWGHLEIVYRRAMTHALRAAGAKVVEEAPQAVYFEGHLVGEYRADLLVDDEVIVELKAAERLAPEHRAQVVNYIKASRLERGLLLNFGPRPEIKRIIFTNDQKKGLPPVP
jgi:GxxExxY protein